MSRSSSLLLACSVFVGAAIGQSTAHHGALLVSWPNTTGVGSPVLDAMVHYPATASGYGTPIVPRAGGYPVIVFLHGYDKLGLDYNDLGFAWARAGFTVVMPNTARTDLALLIQDAQAMPSAIAAANLDPQSPLAGMFAVSTMGVAGHSMGGLACTVAQASCQLYDACLALAPVDPTPLGPLAGLVTVPFGIIVGQGDFITAPQVHAQPLFNSLGTADGLKFLYLMNQDCAHNNIAGLDNFPSAEVFPRTIDIGIGFFRHFLIADPLAMDRCVGAVAQAETRLVSIEQEVLAPQIWVSDMLQVGHRTRISVAGQPGMAGVLVALGQQPGLLTPLGMLLLDPSSVALLNAGPVSAEGRLDTLFDVPENPGLIGFSLSFQALGDAISGVAMFGSAITLIVES
jgi:Chlorophyllase enzyme